MRWNYYPRNKRIDSTSVKVVNAFENVEKDISSSKTRPKNLESNDVLAIVRQGLEDIGFRVESGKKADETVKVPVLYGENGSIAKQFLADAYLEDKKYIVEVEAGRGYDNNQFLKDFFEACTMVDITYLCIAVRNTYRGAKTFDSVCKFFDALYTSGRLGIPLEGLLIIGY